VPADQPGVHRSPVQDILGTRASMLATVSLAGCRVPAELMVGPDGMGLTVATAALDIGRYSVACGCVGIAQACLDATVRYACRRAQGGARLRDHQLVQQMIAKMSTNVQAARLLCRHAGALKDQGDPGTIVATCVAKYFSATAAARAASDAVQVHGANGCRDSAAVARYFRDAKIMEIIEGSTQIHEVLIAQDACRAGLVQLP
jgi:alkylation response protein AidB-like acyl-CoA dehydrogenase